MDLCQSPVLVLLTFLGRRESETFYLNFDFFSHNLNGKLALSESLNFKDCFQATHTADRS